MEFYSWFVCFFFVDFFFSLFFVCICTWWPERTEMSVRRVVSSAVEVIIVVLEHVAAAATAS